MVPVLLVIVSLLNGRDALHHTVVLMIVMGFVLSSSSYLILVMVFDLIHRGPDGLRHTMVFVLVVVVPLLDAPAASSTDSTPTWTTVSN